MRKRPISRRDFLLASVTATAGTLAGHAVKDANARVLTSPLESPLRIYFPTMGKEAPRPTPVNIQKGVGSTYLADCPTLQDSNIMWMYGGRREFREDNISVQWSANPQSCAGIESVPMIWGRSSVGQPIGGNSAWLMGFNEPDLHVQANLTPQEAVSLWAQVEENNPSKWLVSPAAELLWLVNFYNAYTVAYGRPPRLDALAVHYYSSDSVQRASRDLRRKLHAYKQQADEWGVGQIWLSEFAHLTQPIEFLHEVMLWLPDECDRYAWFQWQYRGDEPWAFGLDYNTSLYLDGSLTPLGEAYKDY